MRRKRLWAKTLSVLMAATIAVSPVTSTVAQASEVTGEKEVKEPEAEVKTPGTEMKEAEAEGKEPEIEGKEPEAEGKEPETEGKEPEAEGKEPETEGKEPEAEGKESGTEEKEPEAEAVQENITITYAATEGGKVSRETEEITPGAAAEGSEAIADEGYEFVNWTAEDGTVVCEEPLFIPEIAETKAEEEEKEEHKTEEAVPDENKITAETEKNENVNVEETKEKAEAGTEKVEPEEADSHKHTYTANFALKLEGYYKVQKEDTLEKLNQLLAEGTEDGQEVKGLYFTETFTGSGTLSIPENREFGLYAEKEAEISFESADGSVLQNYGTLTLAGEGSFSFHQADEKADAVDMYDGSLRIEGTVSFEGGRYGIQARGKSALEVIGGTLTIKDVERGIHKAQTSMEILLDAGELTIEGGKEAEAGFTYGIKDSMTEIVNGGKLAISGVDIAISGGTSRGTLTAESEEQISLKGGTEDITNDRGISIGGELMESE